MNAGTTKPPLRLPAFPKGYGARWLWVQSALRRLASAAGISLHIDGAESATVGSDGSMQFKVGAGGGSASTHPFKVSFVSGTTYHVEAGTIDGQLITAQDIDVGGTDPVAILGYPQYNLSIFNSEYVWASSIKTGASAPVLVSSTSTLSDVTTVTSAGNQGRVLIAYIDAGVVYQIATGNIVSTRASDITMTGQMTVTFNRNS